MDTFVNINLLPKRNWKHKLARSIAYILIVGSVGLIAYPFSGMLEYGLAQTFKKNNVKVAVIQNKNVQNTLYYGMI